MFPAGDGAVEILPAPAGPPVAAVVGFSARFAVAAGVPDGWLREWLAPGDLLAPLSPPFLAALGERLGARGDGVDVVLAAPGLGGSSALTEIDPAGPHPRVARARAHREDVHAFATGDGAAVVVLGRGLARRLDVAVEVDAAAPGHAASLRALLGAGFRPIGSEALFFR